MRAIRCCVVLISLLIGASASFAEQEENADARMDQTVEKGQPEVLRLGLDECIDIALKNNRRRPASQFAVEIAEAQHKQALSAYWPRLMLRSSYTRLDEDPNFVFPEETATYTISGLAPVPMEATVTVPEKDIKLFQSSL